MKAVFRVHRGAGGFINASIAPANRSQNTRLSAVEAAIAMILLFGTALLLHFVMTG